MAIDPKVTLFGKAINIPKSEDEKIEDYLNEGKTIGGDKKFKLDIFKTLRAIDKKDRGYYDNLTEQEQKGFAPFVLNRWMSSVNSDISELEEWWVRATNLNFNVNLLNLKTSDEKHAKLQWLMATACSPGFGVMKHQWVGYKKKTGKAINNKVKNFLIEQYPTFKDEDIELLMTLITNKDIRAFAKDLGYSDKEIKKII